MVTTAMARPSRAGRCPRVKGRERGAARSSGCRFPGGTWCPRPPAPARGRDRAEVPHRLGGERARDVSRMAGCRTLWYPIGPVGAPPGAGAPTVHSVAVRRCPPGRAAAAHLRGPSRGHPGAVSWSRAGLLAAGALVLGSLAGTAPVGGPAAGPAAGTAPAVESAALPPTGTGPPASPSGGNPAVVYSWPTGSPVPVVHGFDPPAQRWLAGHRGVDLEAAASPVRAAADGMVVFAGPVAGRPVVSVQHADGVRTTYEPVSPAVSAGQPVRGGEVLGTLAGGGHCAGCLHWGARRGTDDYLDPLSLLARPVRLLPD